MFKLTKADKIILANMEYNPRITDKKLAELCHLSKDSIRYRIKRLESNEIILKYISMIDYKKLGNQSYKLYLKLNCTFEKKEQIKEFFRKQSNTFSLFESQGTWDLAVAIFTKNDFCFNKIENKMLELFGDVIYKKRYCSMVNAEIYEKNFFELENNIEEVKTHKIWGEIEYNHLDDINKEIINLLHENSRRTLLDVSQKVNLSIDAIKNRLNNLEKSGIQCIFKTVINYEKIGLSKYKLLIVPELYSDIIEIEIINFLKNKKETLNIIRTIGEWKLEVEFLIDDYKKLEQILFELNEKFEKYILNLEISIFRNEEIFACKNLLLE